MSLKDYGLTVAHCGRTWETAVDRMITQHHYLKRWPATAAAVFRLDSYGSPVGAIVYSLPPQETFRRYNVVLAWELSRLWVSDLMPKNTETWFIAQTVDWIERNRHAVELLVSYADPEAGHIGTIYKAANWQADGRTDEERKTPRVDLVVEGKVYGRASHIPEWLRGQVERRPRSSKFRYIYWLLPKHPTQVQLLRG